MRTRAGPGLAHTLHLDQELRFDPPSSLTLVFIAGSTEGIHLVNEDDGGLVLPSQLEQVLDQSVKVRGDCHRDPPTCPARVPAATSLLLPFPRGGQDSRHAWTSVSGVTNPLQHCAQGKASCGDRFQSWQPRSLALDLGEVPSPPLSLSVICRREAGVGNKPTT